MNKNRLLSTVLHAAFIGALSLPALSIAQAAPICREIFTTAVSPASSSSSQARVRAISESIYRDPKKAAVMNRAFELIKNRTVKNRPSELRATDIDSIKDPEKGLDGIQYMGYVQFIGSASVKGTFKSLGKMVPYLLGKLGITNTYTLPFLKSPNGDAGFDVSGYRDVDSRFGGNEEFRDFQQRIFSHNGTLMIDIIANHVSVEHEWAKKALSGDPKYAKYREYFHMLDQAPDVIRVESDALGNPMLATYREKNDEGKIVEVTRRVIFPQAANKTHPHYVKMKDGNGRDVWVLHTFYPFQFDLNWNNPVVMGEFLSITGHWANQGVDIIRLDAIPFLFKNEESDPRTLKVVEALREFLAQTSPRTTLIVEANQPPPIVYQYFGEKAKIEVEALKMDMTTSSRGQLAYNFDLMASGWASLISKNKAHFLKSLASTPEPPFGAVWGNFWRVHDELSLEMVPENVRALIYDDLVKSGRGIGFRGNLGVSGRMADFLGRDPQRVSMAFSILLSLRGMPIIYYGDEIMARNNVPYMNQATAERGGEPDTRDANRGPIAKEDFDHAVKTGYATPEGTVFKNVQRQIQMRKQRVSMRRGDVHIIETSHESAVAYARTTPSEGTLAVHNLSGETVSTALKLKSVPRELFDVLSERKIDFRKIPSGLEITLKPYDYLWLDLPSTSGPLT